MADLPTQEQIAQLVVLQTFGKTLMAPFDRVKYLLQCQGELVRLGRMDRPFAGAHECVRRVVSIEGPQRLWRGNAIQVAGILPTALAQATMGLPVQRAVFDAIQPQSPVGYTAATFIAGVGGAFASSLAAYPFDMLRFRLACDVKAFDTAPFLYRNSLEFTMHSNIAERPFMMYRGLGLYLGGSICYRASYLWLFDLFTHIVPPAAEDDASVPASIVVKQVLAGYVLLSAVSLWMYPLDTIRRRLMLSVNHYNLEYRTVAQCVQEILREEGPRGFFRGASFTLLRGAFTTAVSLVVGINI